MSDFPTPDEAVVTPTHISTAGINSALFELSNTATAAIGGSGAITWVANQAVYVPVVVPYFYVVRRLWWINGSVNTTTNVDMAVYNATGDRLVSAGSTAMGTVSVPQYVDITDLLLTPGRYYFAYNNSGTTTRAHGWTSLSTGRLRTSGVLQQAVGAVALPATMASAGAATQALYPVCGVTRTASGY